MGRVRSFVARHYGITQVIVVVVGIEAYELLRHAMTPNWEIAERHAQDVVSWERSLHIEWEEGLQQTFLRLPELVRAMNVFYFVGHFVLTSVFFFWLYHTQPRRVPPLPQRLPGSRRSSRSSSTGASRPLRRGSRTSASRTRSARSRTSTSARRPRRRSRTRSPPCRRCTPAGRSASGSGSSSTRARFLEARRRLLSDRGRPDDRRHGQPLRLRRARRDARDGPRLLAHRVAPAPAGILAGARRAPGLRRDFAAERRVSNRVTVLQSTPRRGVEQSGSSPGS